MNLLILGGLEGTLGCRLFGFWLVLSDRTESLLEMNLWLSNLRAVHVYSVHFRRPGPDSVTSFQIGCASQTQ